MECQLGVKTLLEWVFRFSCYYASLPLRVHSPFVMGMEKGGRYVMRVGGLLLDAAGFAVESPVEQSSRVALPPAGGRVVGRCLAS